jgi:uncharacterized protein (TIRG00374 family)
MLKILFNTVLGLVLIFIWSRFVDIGQILKTLSQVNILYLIPAVFFMFLSPALRALRLKIFLAEIKKISLKDLIYLNGVAMMLNFFIPIRAGEVAKGVYLNTNYNLDLKKSVIWIFLDRFVDFLAVLLTSVILLGFVPTSLGLKFINILALGLTFGLVITYFAVFQVNLSRKIVRFLIPLLIEKHIKIYFEKLSNFILDSFSILKRHPKDLAMMILLSILSYGADAAIWCFIFISLNSAQDFFKMYLGQTLSALTYLIPAAPGYVGSAEASGLLILSGVFKLDSNLASAMIVLFHILSALFILVYGILSVFFLKIDLGVIFKKALNRK